VSRYLILVLVNTPLVLAALLSSLIAFKLGKLSRKKFIIQVCLWVIIFIGLATAKFVYEFLFSKHLTNTEPLSLFDVIEITGIIFVLFMSNRSRIKLESLERRVQDMHQELSIRLSNDKSKRTGKI